MDQPEWDPRIADQRFMLAGPTVRDSLRARKVSKTMPGWLLALSPLVPTLTVVMLVLGVIELTYLVATFSAAFSTAVGAVLSVVLAREDRRILLSRGFDKGLLPSPYIAGVAPWLYLGLRGNNLFPADPRSLRPFWQHVGLATLFLLTATAFPTYAGWGRLLLDRQ